MLYKNEDICNLFKQKLWQNDHSNVIFLNCIYTHSQDACDYIFMKPPAMNVPKFNVHIGNAFQANHAFPICMLKLVYEMANVNDVISFSTKRCQNGTVKCKFECRMQCHFAYYISNWLLLPICFHNFPQQFPVFSVPWSFRNHSNTLIWCSRNMYCYYQCLKQLNIFVLTPNLYIFIK